ncbi:WSC domain-containing protein 2 [Hondaea fermentalgiana]|uniref:WSC domain-containing protein 2 n=1 Tax=Hondaea fermentalgiana TaxID=2315210 RepID=A0A2R5GB49_9STRA|nr:WSC domain-containing protein 2 [Hondaea fermentalgiana]|eukprot:GBG26938.1 WSC domain-containing protein 2 [Hondaea fermentalgiana]
MSTQAPNLPGFPVYGKRRQDFDTKAYAKAYAKANEKYDATCNSRLKAERDAAANEKADSTVVAIKTHFPCKNCWMVDRENYRPVKATGDIPKATHAIYMLRSPFDALLAEFNRLYSGSHTGSSSASSFQGSRWANFVQLKGESWAFHANYWLSQKDESVENLWRDERGIPVYLYYFENLVSNFKTEVVQILQQLRSIQGEENLPAPEIGLQCVLHERDGNFKRKAGKIFNPYTPEQVEYICEISRRFWNEEVWGPCNGQLQKERKLTTSRLPIDMQNNTQDET